jgi:hypothetical protein
MPISKTILLYKYDELSDKAKEKARDWYKSLPDYDWYTWTIDSLVELLDKIGFTNADIRFSGFWSQGDGASFTSGIDLDKLIPFVLGEVSTDDMNWLDIEVPNFNANFLGWLRMFESIKDEVGFSVTRHHRWGNYVHWGTCSVEYEISDYADRESFQGYLSELEADIELLRVQACHAIYRTLQQEYEYLNSDQQVEENIEANDYTFDQEGNRQD